MVHLLLPLSRLQMQRLPVAGSVQMLAPLQLQCRLTEAQRVVRLTKPTSIYWRAIQQLFQTQEASTGMHKTV